MTLQIYYTVRFSRNEQIYNFNNTTGNWPLTSILFVHKLKRIHVRADVAPLGHQRAH